MLLVKQDQVTSPQVLNEQRAVVLEFTLFNELTLYNEHSGEFKAICWKMPVGRATYSTEKGLWGQRRECSSGSYKSGSDCAGQSPLNKS